MEMNGLTETEKRILAALEGEENEFSLPIQQLSLSLKNLKNPPSVRPYPDFSVLWMRAEAEAGLEEFPANKEKAIRFPLYRNRLAVAILGMVVLLATWIAWDFREVPWISGTLSFLSSDPSSETSFPLRISNLYGNAYLLNSDRSFRNSLRNVPTFPTGERVFVEENGFLDVEFSDMAAVRILGGSEVLIHSMFHPASSGKIILHLIRGTVLAKVFRMKKTSEFAIRTDLGEVAVRGTRFAVEGKEASLKVAVTDGKVAFRKIPTLSEEILVFPMFQMEYREEGELTLTPISSSFQRILAELDYLGPKVSEHARFIRSEEDLFRLYSILEQVEMEGGEKMIGVVYGMDEKYLYIRTVEEEIRVPQSKILNVEKIR